ncbi:hypothetical protein [Rhodococcoides kyotonense]|uniref:Uncharacterized protein n=1 Tax=Rhodococcoides kyotonense TaxID=398843 RepID=A0A177YFK9_9NOCA|nr:hypothetical protein [Rhodococcus kyotonensis]OAK54009.1 hypothetical protein A3K89_21110 [Rhodococcus kyotonensis]
MAGTAETMPDLSGLDKAAQLAALRRSMAAIPGRRDHAPTGPDEPGADVAPRVASSTVITGATTTGVEERALSGPVRARSLRTIPTPMPLSDLLPRGALARGTAISITGAGSILVGLVASASTAGHHVALIGQPKFGLLAVHEHGGDLSKVHLVKTGDGDPLDVASVCIDGIDLVISTVHDRDVPPTRARSILARTRTHAGVFAITDGRMPGLDLTISSRPVGYGGIEQGRGRIRSITVETTVHGRGITERTGRYTLTAPTFGEHGLRWSPAVTDAAAGHRPHRLAVAQ